VKTCLWQKRRKGRRSADVENYPSRTTGRLSGLLFGASQSLQDRPAIVGSHFERVIQHKPVQWVENIHALRVPRDHVLCVGDQLDPAARHLTQKRALSGGAVGVLWLTPTSITTSPHIAHLLKANVLATVNVPRKNKPVRLRFAVVVNNVYPEDCAVQPGPDGPARRAVPLLSRRGCLIKLRGRVHTAMVQKGMQPGIRISTLTPLTLT
jgi:hypothetical protein